MFDFALDSLGNASTQILGDPLKKVLLHSFDGLANRQGPIFPLRLVENGLCFAPDSISFLQQFPGTRMSSGGSYIDFGPSCFINRVSGVVPGSLDTHDFVGLSAQRPKIFGVS